VLAGEKLYSKISTIYFDRGDHFQSATPAIGQHCDEFQFTAKNLVMKCADAKYTIANHDNGFGRLSAD